LDQHQSKPKKNITKSSTKLSKNNITTTSWKTCKPRQHHLGIPDTHSSENKYEIGTTKKEHQQNRNRDEESEQVMSAGKWEEGMQIRIIIEKPPRRTGQAMTLFGHGRKITFLSQTQM
jgi:hypothetical protein